VKTFTSPDDLDLFNLSTVFEVSDDGRGNLAISKLLALKNCTFFAIYILLDESTYIFGSWCVVSVFGSGGQEVFVLHTYVPRVQYSCGVVLVFWFWQEIVIGVTYVRT
jgi:hypothetical protein